MAEVEEEQVTLVFFQAEGGIRGSPVTGVQACALPICIQRPYCPDECSFVIHAEAYRCFCVTLRLCEGHTDVYEMDCQDENCMHLIFGRDAYDWIVVVRSGLDQGWLESAGAEIGRAPRREEV